MTNTKKEALVTVVPFPSDVLRQVMTDNTIPIVIDYDNSAIKNKPALIYLTNVNIEASVTFKVSDKENIFALIDSYITQKSPINIPALVISVISILFWLREITPGDDDKAFLEHHSLIKEDDLEDYLSDPQRASNIVRLAHVLDNIPTFIFSSSKEFRDAGIAIDAAFPVINSVDYTGYTFVNLLKSELFTAHYYAQPKETSVTYFKQQFEEYLFKGENLFGSLKDSHLFPSLSMIDGVNFKREDLSQLLANVKEAQL